MLPWKKAHKINFPMLAKVLGWLLMIEGIFMAFPAAVAYGYGEKDWIVFAISSTATFVIGLCLDRFLKPESKQMAKREAFLLTALVWIFFSFFGMQPFLFCSHPLGFTDAFFEAMAGFTTTGCSAYGDIDSLSHGINFWRAMMQWVGGMGIVIFTLAVIPMLNHSGGMQMFNAEVTGITHEKIRPRISQTAKSLWSIYGFLTLLCTLLLWCGDMEFFDSICHAFGTVSTGGFSTHTESLHYWNSAYLDIVVIVFMFLGGINFSLIFFAFRGQFKYIRQNATIKVFLTCILVYYLIYVVVVLVKGEAHGVLTALIFPLFQTMATVTSTGYTVPNFSQWGFFAFALLLPMMFFGGCAGSTSGGAKVDRLIVMVKSLRNSLKKAFQPNKITSVKIDGKVLPEENVSKTVAFLSFYVIIAFGGGLLLCLMDVPVLDSFFSSLSCLTNLGVGVDVASLGEGMASMPMAAKWVLSFLMLVGRLEVFTILILFLPAFWHRG